MKFLKVFLNNKKASLGLGILFFVLSLPGLFYFKLNVDYRVFFNNNKQEVKIFNEFEAVYGKSDFYILALETDSGTIYEKKFLKILIETNDWASQTPHSTRVESLIDYLPESFKKNKIDFILSEKKTQELKTLVSQNSSLVNRLVSKNEKMAALWISIHVPKNNPNAILESSKFIDQKIQNLRDSHPGISVYVSGVSKMNSTFKDYIIRDLKTITPLSLILIFITLLFFLTSVWMALGILITNAVTTASAIGVGSFLGIAMTTPTSMAPTIILTLTVADCLHLALGALKQSSGVRSWEQAVNRSLSVHFRPILLTSLTTIIGFLCLNFSESPTYHDLGNLTAIGVFFAFVYSVLFYSSWLRLKEPKRKTLFLHGGSWKAFTAFLTQNTKAILVTTVFVLTASGFFISKLELDDIFITWFSEKTQFRKDAEKINSHLTGIYTFEYHIKANDYKKGTFSTGYLSEIKNFTTWWKDKPEVWQVYSVLDIKPPPLSPVYKAADLSHIKSPPKANDLKNMELSHRISEENKGTRLTVILKEVTGKQIRKLAKEADQWIGDNMTHALTKTTGATLLFANISLRNINSMLQGFSIGILLITLLLWFVFQNIRLVIISVITNTFPILIALGLWYFLYGIVDLAVSTVASVSFGIIVDDTIHLLCGFCKNKKTAGSVEEALQTTLEEIAPTLIASTMVLNIGFATLMFSQFLLNDTLGLLSLITISTALLFDLLVLPALLIFLQTKKGNSLF